jgi:hypothetical protein
MIRSIVPIVFLALAACGVEVADTERSTCSTQPGPLMRPGWNCLSCHRSGGQAGEKLWSAGGTVYESADADPCDGSPDVDVVFFDPSGAEIERVTTNAAGNFFTATPLPEDFRVGVERDGRMAMMPIPPPAGSCNACHSDPPVGEALGRIHAP